MDALTEFGDFVLQLLQDNEEWSAEMTDEISDKARVLGLAEADEHGYFKRIGEEVTCDCQRANGPNAVCHCDSPEGWS